MLSSLQIIGQEWLILVAVVVVLLFGAKKLPELARSIGKAKGELKKGLDDSDNETKESEDDVSKMKREKLESAAKALGIETEGKSKTQLAEDVRKALAK